VKSIHVNFPPSSNSSSPIVYEGEFGRLVGVSHCYNVIQESRMIKYDLGMFFSSN
jgi:hypothetical protein